jgi:hypothetical protein
MSSLVLLELFGFKDVVFLLRKRFFQ